MTTAEIILTTLTTTAADIAAATDIADIAAATDIVTANATTLTDALANDAAIAAVNACRPDILLVALGVPRQELWLAKHRDELHCGAAIAVGGLLDFVSGRIPRAPAWLRRCGLEWTYRLYQEPVRLFRRYVLGNPAFVLRVLLSRLRGA